MTQAFFGKVAAVTGAASGIGLASAQALLQGGARVAVGEAGATNAALFAVAMLALSDAEVAKKLADFRVRQTEKVLAKTLPEL